MVNSRAHGQPSSSRSPVSHQAPPGLWQRSPHDRDAWLDGTDSAEAVLRSPGQPLDGTARREMESRFAHDFGRVRVHSDAAASASARRLDALAYTVGDDVVLSGRATGLGARGVAPILAHELTHVVQNRQAASSQTATPSLEPTTGLAEAEARRVSSRLRLGLPAGPVMQPNAGIALTPASAAVEPLISYSAGDWAVTDADERAVLGHLRTDPDLSGTIRDLDAAGMLGALISRVDEDDNRRELMRLLGAGLDAAARRLVEPHIAGLDAPWQLQYNITRLGVTSPAPAFNPAPFASLISSTPSDPFTGVGATGTSPTSLSIPAVDQALLAAGHGATRARYSNPIPGSLPAYLATLTPAQRAQQAELLLGRPISSVESASYGTGNLPSRAQVIRAAAAAHNLHPEMLAGFLLAEQRDQSQLEDAKDYLGATSILSGDLSIGLGQVVIGTARRDDLFRDLLASGTRSSLDHDAIARLLASDEFNIFAAARYIRKVADDGSRISIATLPTTQSRFPNIDMAAYARHSSTWPDDNIRALASEYTSTAWDDNLSPGWPDFVWEAYQDVIASGVL